MILGSVVSRSPRVYAVPFGPVKLTTLLAGSQPVMVTVVTRCLVLVAPGSIPGVPTVVGSIVLSTAASPAGFNRMLTRSKYVALMVSPTLTCSNRTAVGGTSSVTTLPSCNRIVTVRAAWSTASTVPWTVT